MASIDDESTASATAAAANAGELTRESLDALKHLRSYQQALVNLYIDGRIDMEKFITHMQAAHAAFQGAEKAAADDRELRRQMLVDDWDTGNPDSQRESSTKQKLQTLGSMELQARESSATAAVEAEPKGATIRDEFSYSLLEAMWMRRQMLTDEDKIQVYHEKVKEMYQALLAKSILNSKCAHEVLDRTTLEKIGLSTVQWLTKAMTMFRTLNFYA